MTKTVQQERNPDSYAYSGLNSLLTGTLGSIIYGSGSDSVTSLPAGSAGQFLTIASSVPAWTSTLPSAQLDHNSITLGTTTIPLGTTVTTFTGITAPSSALDVANKAYVDAHASGLTIESPAAEASSGSDLSTLGTYTYNNGVSGVGATITDTDGSGGVVLVIDGVAPGLNARVLIKDQTD